MKKMFLMGLSIIFLVSTGWSEEAIPQVKGNTYLSFWTSIPSNSWYNNGNGVRLEFGLKKNFTLGLKLGRLNNSEWYRSSNSQNGNSGDEPLPVSYQEISGGGGVYGIEGTYFVSLFARRKVDLFIRAGLELVELNKREFSVIPSYDNHWVHPFSTKSFPVIQANYSVGARYWIRERLALGMSLQVNQNIWRYIHRSKTGFSFQATVRI